MNQPHASVRTKIESRSSELRRYMTIDNQSKLNALSRALMDQFAVEAARLADLNELRVVVVTGAGPRAFVGGADIREMAALQTPQDAREFIGRVHSCCNAVRSMPVPVIARIQGFAFGAGLELAASCDLRVASDAAMFGMPEVKLGIPSVVEAALLPALIGWGRTRELLFLGEAITAHEALRWKSRSAGRRACGAGRDGRRFDHQDHGMWSARNQIAEVASQIMGRAADSSCDCSGN